MRPHRWYGVIGLISVVIGLVGLAALAGTSVYLASGGGGTLGPVGRMPGLSPYVPPAPEIDGEFTPGARIYYLGTGAKGPIPKVGGPIWFSRMLRGREVGCVICHGPDGRGRRTRVMHMPVSAPDIRYSTLTSEHEEQGVDSPPWSDEDIERAVRDGVEPDGERLNGVMPRWDMSDEDMRDLIDYLRELSAR